MGASNLLFWRSSWWQKSYISDYIAIVALGIASLIIEKAASPYQRFVPAGSTDILYPLKPDIIPDWVPGVVSVVIPFLIILCFQLYVKSLHDLHDATLGILLSNAITLLITTVLKYLVGRYRPDAVAMGNVDNARESFPSGHSSISFCGLTFLSLYLAAKFHVFSHRVEEDRSIVQTGNSVSGLASLVPLLLAGFIAVSRTMDYHHDFSDILAGSLLGAFVAIWSYFLFFHVLTSADGHKPRCRTPIKGPVLETEVTLPA